MVNTDFIVIVQVLIESSAFEKY